MATSGYNLLKFIEASEDSFYFEVDNPDLEMDDFRISVKSQHLIQSKDQKYLILSTNGDLQVKNLNRDELLDPEHKFNIQIYKDSALEPRKGRAVMLYANKNGQKVMVCCNESGEIYAEAMDPPPMVKGQKHKALFYMMEHSASNQYRFESTMHHKRFLGFESDKNNPYLQRLVLKASDEVDESCRLYLSDCEK